MWWWAGWRLRCGGPTSHAPPMPTSPRPLGRTTWTGWQPPWSRYLPTKREAEAALARLLVEVDGGQQGGTDVTFGALLERWFEMRSPDWSPKTVLEHRRFIDRLVGPALGSITLRKLRSEDLDRFYARLRKSGGQGGKPLKASSVRRSTW